MTVLTTTSRMLAMGLAALLCACASFTPTPYQAAHDSGYGYHDQRLDADVYRIRVTGNGLTSPQRLVDYLLYRASALALAHGRSGFRLIGRGKKPLELRPARLFPAFGPVKSQTLRARTLTFDVDPPIAAPRRIPPAVAASSAYVAQARVRLADVARPDGRRRFSATAVQVRLRGDLGGGRG